jgi:hypothetical protein
MGDNIPRQSITIVTKSIKDKTTMATTTITMTNDFQPNNLHFGDNINHNTDAECFLFHNINGIKDETNWVQINSMMKELNITGFGFSEINTTFRGLAYNKWNNITRKIFKHSRIIASESNIIPDNSYKPGGTLTAITGKWQSRITAKGVDPLGLGRWSYFILSSNKKSLVIVTAYQPLKTKGPKTQQWILLRESAKTPDPIKSFCINLEKETKLWVNKGFDILLMINANEDIGSQPGGLSNTISSAGLFDLVDARHNAGSYPNTYARGTKRIDYIFGTERVRKHCISSGILPFGYRYSSDHRAIFIRLKVGKVLSMTIHPSESSTTRLLMSATPNERVKFIIELDIHYLSQNLYNRLQELWETPHTEWSDQHTNEFNKCNEQHIMGMLAAEKNTCKIKLGRPNLVKQSRTKHFGRLHCCFGDRISDQTRGNIPRNQRHPRNR